MSSRRLDQEPEITAQPRTISDELRGNPIAEPGLSVQPEDLGRQFLSEATEQANFESSRGGDTPEMYPNDPAPTDEALTGAVWEQDRSLWEQTVNMTLQAGGLDEAREQGSIEGNEQAQGLFAEEPGDVDMIEDDIHDMSLLDREAERPGEVKEPKVLTDEQDEASRKREAANADTMSAVRRPGGRGDAKRLKRRAEHTSSR
jgi:hypothetical protein